MKAIVSIKDIVKEMDGLSDEHSSIGIPKNWSHYPVKNFPQQKKMITLMSTLNGSRI